MAKHSLLRRIRKWVALVLSVLLVLGWIASITAKVVAWYGHVYVAISSGCVKLHLLKPSLYFHCAVSDAEEIVWLPGIYLYPPRQPLTSFAIHVPFCCIVIPAVIATVILWRHDRDFPLGHCGSCGYNLTGNASGVCPECGAEAGSPVTESAR